MNALPNQDYTSQDHAMREYDRYARAKYQTTMRWLRPHLFPRADLYNVGVGSGYFNHLAVGAGLRVVGCEPDPDAFNAAYQTRPVENCELLPLSLEEFAHLRAPADFLVMHDVLEHILDEASAVENMARLLKPGGRAIISVPALQSLFGRHDIELGHHRRYTRRTLTDALTPRFDIERMHFFGMASIPIVYYFSVFRKSSYPKAAASDNLLSRAYGAVCDLESHFNEPIGTALIAQLARR